MSSLHLLSLRQRQKLILPIAALGLVFLCAQAQCRRALKLSLDRYGGLSVSLAKPTGHFRVAKVGNRWLFVTPDGNPFWMFGVWNIVGDDHLFPAGTTLSYSKRTIAKYGDADLTWGPQQVRRLKSWGFNTIGPYSVSWVTPTQSDNRWPGDHTQPVKAPYVFLENFSWYCLTNSQRFGTRPVKDLIAGVKRDILSYYGGNFPDVYDPAFETYIQGMLQHDPSFLATRNSPWVIGYMSADTDNMWGFGAGPDFVTTPPGHNSDHLGLIVLITAPTQGSNSNLATTYADTQVYSKTALANFLQTKYKTIQALNTAWSSNYTTFSSAGGWGVGTGLLDESGTMHHKWLGKDTVGLRGFNPNVAADLGDFLFQVAKTYFTVCRSALKKAAPDALYFGVTSLGAWNAPPRRQILEGAAGLIDVLATNIDSSSEAQLNFIHNNLGDVPIVEWTGWRANPDSAMFRTPRDTDFQTQGQRAAAYTNQVDNMWGAAASSNGSHPFVGLLWWEFHDNVGENSNWGLVSLSDNAYDGVEAVNAGGRDSWGFKTGGEERDYGDFVSGVRAKNHECATRLQNELQKAVGGDHR